MPKDGRPLKRPLIQNFVVSSEVVKKNVQKIRPSFFVVYCATPEIGELLFKRDISYEIWELSFEIWE